MTRGDFAGSTEKRTWQRLLVHPRRPHLQRRPINNAFKRISKNKLGIEYNISQSKFLSTYEHFYDNNVFNHIVMGFEMSLEEPAEEMKEQHEAILFEKYTGEDDIIRLDDDFKYK